MSCGDGAHGPRVYDWVRVPIRPYWAPGRGHWLPAPRSISDPTEIAYYICYAPRRTTLATLIWVAGRRWPVEECFKQAKQETGLDHYQVRTWRGWYARIDREVRPPVPRPIRGKHVAQQALIDTAGRQGRITGTVTTAGTRSQAQIRHPGHRDRHAQSVHQIEQRVRPPVETVVHLTPEPAKFTLVTTNALHDTTNNGHLILPRRFASSSENEQVAVPCQSLNRATDHQPTLNAKLSQGS
jgi:hypothetical protein